MIKIKMTFALGCFAMWMLTPLSAHAAIELPNLLSDNAVLQRGKPIPIWGKTEPKQLVTVTLDKQALTTTSNPDGSWSVQFAALEAGGPVSLSITTNNDTKTLKNIHLGDVWVASGQSNMEWPLINTLSADTDIPLANNPQIRHFKVPKSSAALPEDHLVGGNWQVATPDTVGDFSAIAYYFAQQINSVTGVPIGIINSTWGGSSIEAWMSPEGLDTTAQNTQAAIEKIYQEAAQGVDQLRKTLAGWPGAEVNTFTEAKGDWSAADLNTNDWVTLGAPRLWEQQGFTGMDGVAWYRKQFSLTVDEAAHDISLGLGRIDDSDITWVNGQKVGASNAYDAVRRYLVPAQYLQAGINTIAVRVEDTGGGGGIYSDAELLYVQTSTRKQSLAGPWKFKAEKVVVSSELDMNRVETALYNKMLHPLFKTPIKGIIWYQGESNAGTIEQANRYAQQFPTLINEWRSQWHNPSLPFYWVQLAAFDSRLDSPLGSPWSILRRSQTATLSLPHTGQAITIDVGNAKDIHPRDKKTVGYRLAAIALNQTYGKHDQHYRGPVLKTVKVNKNTLLLTFDASKGLQTRTGDSQVNGFEVADGDGVYHSYPGLLIGLTVSIALPQSLKPIVVRYAWSDNPETANLTDTTGLPAEPFSRVIYK